VRALAQRAGPLGRETMVVRTTVCPRSADVTGALQQLEDNFGGGGREATTAFRNGI